MAKFTVRYLVAKPGTASTVRWFWQPAKALRGEGWRSKRLCAGEVFFDKVPPPQVIAEAGALNQALDDWRAGRADQVEQASRKVGTVGALITRYKASKQYLGLAQKTRTDYERYLDIIDRWIGELPVRAARMEDAVEFYDRLFPVKPRAANYTMQVLRLLFEFARLRGKTEAVEVNPFLRPKLQGLPKRGRIWSPEAAAAFVVQADRLGHWSVGTAVMLNEWMGQREGDVLAMPKSVHRDGGIWIDAQRKTGANVMLPIDMVPSLHRRLQEEYARQARRPVTATTIIAREDNGLPYSSDRFRKLVYEIRMAAKADCPELEHLWFMHLRHTAICRLKEANCELGLICAVSGHEPATVEHVIKHYYKRTPAMAKRAFKMRLETEGKGE